MFQVYYSFFIFLLFLHAATIAGCAFIIRHVTNALTPRLLHRRDNSSTDQSKYKYGWGDPDNQDANDGWN
ncbi:hypothetical protein QCA50_014713 [Cerrena zonata]|uniref:Uncharacterized protein n=1 Tax=Cerrena zonata TaxID=2478898 RepID=A0AAW0FS64_9APHY